MVTNVVDSLAESQSYSNPPCGHFSDRATPSLTGTLNAIEVLDRVPGDWWRARMIIFYGKFSGVERRHVDRIREIQASIAGGAA
ncbi:MAG: hypothetical protein IGR90_06180 [Synechococcales cyanobacterium K32_A2020_035]|nr:hypothetical protein [Synechococcales cyanobacterium K32_A2020_035]